jgi:protein required for attachment to host cells
MVLHLAKNDWLLIADGSRAKVLINKGTAARPAFETVRDQRFDNPPSREHGTDRPARSNDAMGRRTVVDETDFHQREEDRFVASLAGDLEKDLQAAKFDRLVVVLPPKALAVWRNAAAPKLKKTIVAEIDKDWTKLSSPDLGHAIVKELGERSS